MTTFFIAPYEPSEDPADWEDLRHRSDLSIDPEEYRQLLIERWPSTTFFQRSDISPLEWEIRVEEPDQSGAYGTIGMLHGDLQVVSVETPFEEFFLWHREIISNEHRLFLFNDSSYESLELTEQTTLREIQEFVGGS